MMTGSRATILRPAWWRRKKIVPSKKKKRGRALLSPSTAGGVRRS